MGRKYKTWVVNISRNFFEFTLHTVKYDFSRYFRIRPTSASNGQRLSAVSPGSTLLNKIRVSDLSDCTAFPMAIFKGDHTD